jgi:hypothetical protein
MGMALGVSLLTRAGSGRDYAVEQTRKDLDAQADSWKTMDARILALILLGSALFSFTVALIGFDKMPNLSSLATTDAFGIGDLTTGGILAVVTLILTSVSLFLLAAVYWGSTLLRPRPLFRLGESPVEVQQDRWLADAHKALETNARLLERRQANTVRALYLLAGQCFLVVYVAAIDVFYVGGLPVFGVPGKLITGLTVVGLACVLIWMGLRPTQQS